MRKSFVANLPLAMFLVVLHSPKQTQCCRTLLLQNGFELVKKCFGNKDSFRVQIIYTQIDQDKKQSII